MTTNFTLSNRHPLAAAVIFALVYASFTQSAVVGQNASNQQSSTAKKDPAAESKFTTLDGARVHYVNYGKGSDAIVLVHGWTQSIDSWREQIPDLAQRSRVIALDLPGHGQSDKPEFKNKDNKEPVNYNIDLFTRAVEAVMRDAKVKRAVLVGHSMGTPIARQFYRKYPDKTLGIVIADGSLKPFPDRAMMDNLLASLRSPRYEDSLDQMFTGMMGPGLSAEARERINSSTAKTPQYVLVSAMASMMNDALWGDDKMNVPVLAIMAKTAFFPPNLEEIYGTLAPNLEFHQWEGVGHFVMTEKPKEFNQTVLAWLDKNKLLK
jgi:pimeloyl-ACP methyl ester carboxylesterase